MTKKRSTYLLVTQVNTLDTWGKELEAMFPASIKAYGVYIVGSATKSKDWRDVDIRHILDDKSFQRLKKSVDIGYFNHAISLWGQQITGLPIDYQVMNISHEDNQTEGYRHPIGMRDGYINGEKRI